LKLSVCLIKHHAMDVQGGGKGWVRMQFHSPVVSSYPVLPGFETWWPSWSPIIVRNIQYQLKSLQ